MFAKAFHKVGCAATLVCEDMEVNEDVGLESAIFDGIRSAANWVATVIARFGLKPEVLEPNYAFERM